MNVPCVRTGQTFNPRVDIDEIVCDVIRRRCEVFYGVTGNAIRIASGILIQLIEITGQRQPIQPCGSAQIPELVFMGIGVALCG